jgi:hypothetical protein
VPSARPQAFSLPPEGTNDLGASRERATSASLMRRVGPIGLGVARVAAIDDIARALTVVH